MSDNDQTKIEQGIALEGFRLERKLGKGGMGEVWLADQETMDRKVALKILSPALTTDDDFTTRFIKEVKVSAKLHHPNIVTAYHAGTDQGLRFLVMSYVDGVELKSRLKDGGVIPEAEALDIVKQVASALDYAWEDFQIIHRDIKPSNVMLDTKGKAMVMDMGISKSMSEDNGLTMTGMIIGTPHYMSPEQARGDGDLDFRTDVYALGATLYHMVTGGVPYDATTAMGVLAKHMTEPFPPPQERNPEVSDECAALLETMMAKDAEDRQASWKDVIADVDAVLAGNPPITPRPGMGQSIVMRAADDKPEGEKKPVAKWVSALALIALVAIVAAAKLIGRSDEEPATDSRQDVVSPDDGTKGGDDAPKAPPKPQRPPFNPRGLKKSVTFTGHKVAVNGVAISPDGTRIATVSLSGKAKVWDARSGEELLSLKGHYKSCFSTAFSPDGMRIVTSGGEGLIKTWDAMTGDEFWAIKGHEGAVYTVAFSPDGRQIVSCGYDKTAKLWEAKTGELICTMTGHSSKIVAVSFNSDGSRLITGCGDRTAKVWDSTTGKELFALNPGQPVMSAVFSPDGDKIAIGCWDNSAAVYDAESKKMLLKLSAHRKPVSSICYSPDGKYLVTGSRDATAKIWDAETGANLKTLLGHTKPILSAVFSPDGTQILTGSWDGTAILWKEAEKTTNTENTQERP